MTDNYRSLERTKPIAVLGAWHGHGYMCSGLSGAYSGITVTSKNIEGICRQYLGAILSKIDAIPGYTPYIQDYT